MKTKQLMIMCLAGLSSSAWAIEPGPASSAQQGTESWMQLQIRGVVASTNLQTASAAERELAMQRWLNSFTYPIPEYFNQDTGGEITNSK
ncbi:DUF3613 domain-containing protein [Pseudomonas sp. RGM2987]|uniref:DUF3613 domain-containing protein n=1 Tax=Pseudomonas sp. RGM2987 TaxID=2930090 RepID=UPI001FD6C299|nr:DUF3613 domain-containing protein [Pseudomonas sp. RGM2987]MCJ8204638.1 DUF3613 domain-containing protein [Pseudomonas sp. RGM2987]